MKKRPVMFVADAVVDATGFVAVPGAVLVAAATTPERTLPSLLAAGSTTEVGTHPAAKGAWRVDVPGHVLMPPLVNAHSHLDLSHIGPQPHDPDRGFVPWIDMIRSRRHTDDDQIAQSVALGAELSMKGGVGIVGDIAGAPQGRQTLSPARALTDSCLLGCSYVEFFAIGQGEARSLAALESTINSWNPPTATNPYVRLGVQPHAPNTVSIPAYRRAVELAAARGMPLATHLAETMEEREFVAHARGPQRDFLEALGLWTDQVLEHLGHGAHPVEHLGPILKETPFIAAHVNDAPDRAIELLASTRTSVAYCPRASSYFGADRVFGPHRYRDMLRAGINVALGTDSIVNLDTPDRISTLDEMRFLWRRDGTDPLTLLAMATINGAKALGIDPSWVTLRTDPKVESRPIAGLIAVKVEGERSASGIMVGSDPLGAALAGQEHPDFLLSRIFCCLTRK